MTGVLVVDEPEERVAAWRTALEASGYRIATATSTDGGARVAAATADVIVLGAPAAECGAWDLMEDLRSTGPAAEIPVVVIVSPGALEDGLRGAIEGAVRCMAEPFEGTALVATLDAVLASDAPSTLEQRRVTRQRALEVLARIESRGADSDADVHPRLVHLTRLEHAPVRNDVPQALVDARRRINTLTTKQRGLLHLVEAEGGVTAAAARLGTSRGNVYAGLRRIVHRLGVRDTGELLRFIASGELLRSARS